MKKILILAAVVAMCGACSHSYEVTPVAKDGGQIGFGTWKESLTRYTPGSANNGFVAGDTFAVSGYKTKGETKTEVFDDVVVTASGTPVTWDYTDHRFWDKSCNSYTFFAVSPALISSVKTVDITPTTGLGTSTEITFGGNNNDILVATKNTVTRTGTGQTATFVDSVQMSFNHVASLFDLKVKRSANLGTATVKIKSITLNNIRTTGTFEISGYNSTTNKPELTGSTWTPDATPTVGSYTNASGATPIATTGEGASAYIIANVDATNGDYLIKDLVVMPQEFAASGTQQSVTIVYSITETGGDEVEYTPDPIILRAFDNLENNSNADTAITSWAPGYHYTFTITIDVQTIKFTGRINEWTVGDPGYYYLMN